MANMLSSRRGHNYSGLSRDDYRKIKGMSKEEMSRWLDLERSMTYNSLRKEFEQAYKDELDCGVSNFLIAMWYTLHFNEDLHLQNDELASFMEDLFVSVDMFRKGEYKPEDYEKELKDDGVQFAKYDYSKLYKELEEKYVEKIRKLEETIASYERDKETDRESKGGEQ